MTTHDDFPSPSELAAERRDQDREDAFWESLFESGYEDEFELTPNPLLRKR
jgi:hypothetical protein